MEEKVKSIDRAGGSVKENADKARDKLAAARGKMEGLAGEVQQKAKKVSGEVQQRAKKVSEDVRRQAEQASEVARQRYEATAENVRRGYDKARKDLDGLVADVNEYVRDNPGRAVLIAAGVGFILGLMFRGERREG